MLHATQEIGNYWIYVRGLTDCSQKKTQILAVLHYHGAGDGIPSSVPNTYDEYPQGLQVRISDVVMVEL